MNPNSFEQQAVENLRTLRSWAIVLSVGLVLTILLAIYGFATASSANSDASIVAKRVARVAQQEARQAHLVSIAAVLRLQAEADGECYRVNYLRWQINHADYVSWRRDVVTARFLSRFPERQLRAVARVFHLAAQAWHYLPLTDCTLATTAPVTYRPPSAVPFNVVPPALLHIVLRSPPQPPR